MSDTIKTLQETIRERKLHPREGSYTCELFAQGKPRILKKVGEEAAEVVIAAALESSERLVSESADLIYHLLVALVNQGLGWDDVEAELKRRFH